MRCMAKEERAYVDAALAVGLTAFWAWTHLMAFRPHAWLDGDQADAGVAWIVSNFASLVALALMFFAGCRHAGAFRSRGCIGAVAVVGACSGAGLVAPGVPDVLRIACTVAASACDMAFIGCWAAPYVAAGGRGRRTAVTLAAIVASFAVYLALAALPGACAPVAMAALPVISAACLWRIDGASCAGAGADTPCPEPTPVAAQKPEAMRPPLLVLGFIMVFSIPLNFLQTRGIGFSGAEAGYVGPFILALVLLACACAAELACSRKGWSVLPLAMVLLLSLALLGSPDSYREGWVMSGVTLAGYFLFLSVTYLQLSRCVDEGAGGANPVCIFSAGMLANAIGLLLGTVLGFFAQAVSVGVANVVTLGIVYGLFVLGMALLPHRMKQLLLNQKAEERDVSPKNQYVANMVQSINEQCARVAGCFGLTEREGVVLGYLVRGWSLQMIAEEENLARSTIKTHVTHIYQKLGVHTREELVLVVESVGE